MFILNLKPGKLVSVPVNIWLQAMKLIFTVKGKGGHGAMPYNLIDPVVIASQIIISLQQIVSRNAHFSIPTVLSFGEFIADGTYNIIPNEVTLKGTFRTFNEEWRAIAHQKIEKIAKSTAQAAGGDCEVFIDKGYPFLVNDEELVIRSFKYAKEYLGEENVVELDMRMTAEDFAYFAQAVPSCFYRLGVKNDEKELIQACILLRLMLMSQALKQGWV